jgi:hypothetical protein
MPIWSPPPGSPQAHAIASIAARSSGAPLAAGVRVTLNFHPDRCRNGVPILVAMAGEGIYRSQFETGTSNGGLTAHPGGARWLWESRIFAGAYDGAAPAERPKYGALNVKGSVMGGAPRFGSAHLRLRAEVLARCTFCYPDSVFEPAHFGIAAKMGQVLGALHAHDDPLDDYIEAHVHGPLRLVDDVEALVLDPCYQGTAIEAQAQRLLVPVEWHPGFRLPVDVLRQHPQYRGQRYVDLGVQLARHGVLDPACLGAGEHDPQDLKKVWHCLARYGA